MIKILHVITDVSIGGAEMMLHNIISRMERGAFECQVVSMMEIGAVGKMISALGVPVQALGMRRNQPNPVHIWRLASLIRRYRPHIVQTWMYHADLFGLLASKLTERPRLVWNIRCSNIPMYGHRPVTGWVAKCCSQLSAIPDAIIVNSKAGMDYHVRIGYQPSRMQYIPNGFDLERFRPDSEARSSVRSELGLPADALIIGLVARWDPLKDHSTFLKAAARIAMQHKKAYFLLIGGGMQGRKSNIMSFIRVSGIQDRVFLLGEREDIPRLTAAFDIACSSSVTEGFPNTVGEAMAVGVPCVVTDVGDSAAIVGDTGCVVPSNDAAALSLACMQLIEMGQEGRQEIGRRARDRIQRRYALTDMVKEYEDLYTTLVHEGRLPVS